MLSLLTKLAWVSWAEIIRAWARAASLRRGEKINSKGQKNYVELFTDLAINFIRHAGDYRILETGNSSSSRRKVRQTYLLECQIGRWRRSTICGKLQNPRWPTCVQPQQLFRSLGPMMANGNWDAMGKSLHKSGWYKIMSSVSPKLPRRKSEAPGKCLQNLQKISSTTQEFWG